MILHRNSAEASSDLEFLSDISASQLYSVIYARIWLGIDWKRNLFDPWI